MKIRNDLALALAIVPLVSLSCKSTNRSEVKTEISSKSSNLPSSGLGEGFNSDNFTFVSQCLTGNSTFIGESNSKLDYSYEMGYDEVIDTLSGGLKLGAKFGIFNIEGAADYASREASDDFSYTTSVTSTIELKKIAFEPNGLTEVGRSLVNPGGDVDESTRRVCGDEYISHITYGASLFVNLKFRFQSAQDKEEFKGAAKVDLTGLGEIGGNLGKMSDKIKKNTSITISAYQVGGAVQNLNKILDENIFKCTMADFESNCLPTLRNLVNYAKDDFPKNLADPVDTSKSVKENVERIKNSGWSQLRYTTKKYAEKTLNVKGISRSFVLVPAKASSLVTREIKQIREDVYDAYEQQLTDYQRASDLLKDAAMKGEQREAVKVVQKATGDNRRNLANVGETCIREPQECSASYEDYKASAKPYNERSLNFKACLVTEDLEGSYWKFARSNGSTIGIIQLGKGGKINLAASNADVTWKVEGCLLRFYNVNGVHTTSFDDIKNVDEMTGIYYFNGSFRHLLTRVDTDSKEVRDAIAAWKASDEEKKKLEMDAKQREALALAITRMASEIAKKQGK